MSVCWLVTKTECECFLATTLLPTFPELGGGSTALILWMVGLPLLGTSGCFNEFFQSMT